MHNKYASNWITKSLNWFSLSYCIYKGNVSHGLENIVSNKTIFYNNDIQKVSGIRTLGIAAKMLEDEF